jgi:predicted CXXCH cytochrome family protein
MSSKKLWAMVAVLAAGTALGGCVDERIVFQDRPIFEQPPAAAGEFVGYSNPTTKVTVCGNCHVGVQTQWRQTAHASAWETLQAHPARQAMCEGCHTTNELGNPATQVGGFKGVAHERYRDVQCESCHGPNLAHVQNPTRANWPLAPMTVGVNQQSGCGQCHGGSHYPYVNEWARSRHGTNAAAAAGNVAATAVGNRAECRSCHTGEDALIAFGVNANYLEKGALQAPGAHMPITCAVCHDPHENTNPGQLRFSVSIADEEQNLCMKCHHKRGVPDPTTFRGPHSPEGPMLLGYGGNWFPNMHFPDGIVATHGSERNPRLCAGCHVNTFDQRDPTTGGTIRGTGHTFEATPCVDANGVPVPGPCGRQQKTYQTCTGAGCHASQAVARSSHTAVEQRFLLLTDQLDALLTRVTPNWKQCRATGNCPGTPFHWADNVWTTAEGAAFNYEMARATSGARANQIRFGAAVHNPALMEVLLITSIREVQREYGLTLDTTVPLERTIGVGR